MGHHFHTIFPIRPPPPIPDSYSLFGLPVNNDDAIIQSLESQVRCWLNPTVDCSCSVKNANSLISQGFKRLYSAKDIDRKKELRKLNHSVLVNFLDLIDILIKCPESPKRDEKIEDINLLFIHMHHLINEFRPHQARETLRVMLMVQRRKRTRFTSKFKEQLEKVESIIQEAIENLPEVDTEGLCNLYYSIFLQNLNAAFDL